MLIGAVQLYFTYITVVPISTETTVNDRKSMSPEASISMPPEVSEVQKYLCQLQVVQT